MCIVNEREPILENPRLGPSINHVTGFSLLSDPSLLVTTFVIYMGHHFPINLRPPLTTDVDVIYE